MPESSELPIVDPAATKPVVVPRWRTIVGHLIRVTLLLAILLAAHARYSAARIDSSESSVNFQPDIEWLPAEIRDRHRSLTFQFSGEGQFDILAEQVTSAGRPETKVVASLLSTSPASDSMVGYIGPTTGVIVVDESRTIGNLAILNSADTAEHVEAIVSDPNFLHQWNGLPIDRPNSWPSFDAVSGATLTSLAIIQGVQARAGMTPENLKFPDPVTEQEIRQWLELPDIIIQRNERIDAWELFSGEQQLGYVVRTSPAADHLNGYQGPTDCLTFFDDSLNFQRFRIRGSYDNQPYVRYVEEDGYLESLLAGKSVAEVVTFPADQYEGVSGATMTSLNVREVIQHRVEALAASLQAENQTDSNDGWKRWVARYWADAVTLLMAVLAVALTFSSRRQSKWIRGAFMLAAIGYLGWYRGDVLSQALLLGWSRHGLPWLVAPGLVGLALISLVVPIISKHNVYCNQLCPFGACQHVVHQVSPSRWSIGRRWRRWLKLVPGVLLLLVAVVAAGWIRLDLASIEPFHAFAWRVAGWATIVLFFAGLVFSWWVPLGYCRYGCPTGAVLSYVRFNRRSGQINRGDWVAVLVLALLLLSFAN